MPALFRDAWRGVVEITHLSHHAAHSLELQHQVVPERAELDLEVASAVAEQEQLDDLVIPELWRRSRGVWWRRIAVERRFELEIEPERTPVERDVNVLAFGS